MRYLSSLLLLYIALARASHFVDGRTLAPVKARKIERVLRVVRSRRHRHDFGCLCLGWRLHGLSNRYEPERESDYGGQQEREGWHGQPYASFPGRRIL
jgi:hypothetical protein